MKSPVAMEINEAQVAESLEEPEEGEIIDDLDVVSDDSITFSPQKQGKSLDVDSTDLCALSLSSLTDLEVVIDGGKVSSSSESVVVGKTKRKRQQQLEDEKAVYSILSTPIQSNHLELEDISPSVSDISLSPDRQPRKKRHLHHHKHTRKRRKVHSSRTSIENIDSDSEAESLYLGSRAKRPLRRAISTDFLESHLHKSLKEQLKAAIFIDLNKESHKNSLQDRILAMTKKDNVNSDTAKDLTKVNETVDDSLLQEIDCQNNSQESSEEHIGDDIEHDSELIELRLEALKTALKNKYKDKKQKQKSGTETNKENTNSDESKNNHLDLSQTINCEQQQATESAPQSPEEDEDVLRALLLASMSNKITRKITEINQTSVPTKAIDENAKIVTSSKFPIRSKPPVKVNVRPFKINNVKKDNFAPNKNNKRIDKRVLVLPKVKPLIINFNSDSDTEDDLFSTQYLEKCATESKQLKTTTKTISSQGGNDQTLPEVINVIQKKSPIVKSVALTTAVNTELCNAAKSNDTDHIKSSDSRKNPLQVTQLASIENHTVAKVDILDHAEPKSVLKDVEKTNLPIEDNKIAADLPNTENRTEPDLPKNIALTELKSENFPITANTQENDKVQSDPEKNNVLADVTVKENPAVQLVVPSSYNNVTFVTNSTLFPINPSVIESSVEHFLREQRAKVEAEKKAEEAKKIVITRDLNNDELIVGKKAPIIDVANAKGSTLSPSSLSNLVVTRNLTSGAKKVDLPLIETSPKAPNSAVKLLPKNKQIEYQKLLMKLRNAEKKVQIKKPRARKMSQRLSASEPNNNNLTRINDPSASKKLVKSKSGQILTTKTNESPNKPIVLPIGQSGSGESSRLLEARKSDAVLLHSTLKQMQQKVNGRLQIQEKYNCLKPLMKKINEVSKEQKHWNQEVKRLLDELTEAKTNQERVHQEMTDSVRQLVEKKAKIDQNNTTTTTTALKPNNQTNSPTFPTSQKTSYLVDKNAVQKSKISNNSTSLAARQNNFRSPKRVLALADAKGNNTSDSDVNIGDPNDIEIVLSKENKKKIVRKSLSFGGTEKDLSRKNMLQSKLNKYPNGAKILRCMSETPDRETKPATTAKLSKQRTEEITKAESKKSNISKITKAESKNSNISELTKLTNELEELLQKEIYQDIRDSRNKKPLGHTTKECDTATQKIVNKAVSREISRVNVEFCNKGTRLQNVVTELEKNKIEDTALSKSSTLCLDTTRESGAKATEADNLQKRFTSSKYKYVSPLDRIKRPEVIDPFSIMCPFEVDGTCKDPECSYKHFLPK